MNRILLYTFILSAGFFITSPVISQEISDPEAEYSRIRTLAFSGDYTASATAARKLVNQFPSYGDARILLGRILAWQKDFTSAAAVIDTLLMTEPDNQDALSARRDISLWSTASSPVSTDVRAGYFFDTFSDPYSRYWQVFKAGAGHRFNWGPGAAYINVGNVAEGEPAVHSTEVQFEAEAYPKISTKNYAFLSYAYSPGSYFPRHRGGLELWQILPKGWAISAGMNYYYFDRSNYIALGSIEKYAGKYWLSVKTYVYFKDEGPTTSFYLNMRRYFRDNNYLQLTLGTGTAPDEPFDLQLNLERYSAYSMRLAYNQALSSRLTMRLNAGYSHEEYAEGIWRDRFEGGVDFTWAIKMK